MEVADSSVRYDTGKKLAAYAKAGIREYWVVNLVKRAVEVYRGPSPDGTYKTFTRLEGEDSVSPEAFPDVVIKVAVLLRAESSAS